MALPYCFICHNIYLQSEDISSTPCGHVYHHDCLIEWLNTAPTCPQCRNDCNPQQTKRIYIDFACDEELACAQIQKIPSFLLDNSDAEDTIKLLLEHIDTKPEETAKSNQECEYCKEILMAFNETQDEKDNMKKVLAELELENGTLITNNRSALKRADELEVKLKELRKQLEESEKNAAAIQSEDLYKQDTIDNLQTDIQNKHFELKMLYLQVEELTDKLKEVSIENATELQHIYAAIQTHFNGIWQRNLLKKHFKSYQYWYAKDIDSSNSQQLVPFSGNITEWKYMIIPLLENTKQK